jgi:hypothetical protein
MPRPGFTEAGASLGEALEARLPADAACLLDCRSTSVLSVLTTMENVGHCIDFREQRAPTHWRCPTKRRPGAPSGAGREVSPAGG